MYDVMRFWFDRGVDGFRIDVLWLLIKDDQFRDNPPDPDWKEGDPPYKRFLETYNADQPEVHAIVRGMRQLTDEYQDRVLIGEIYLPYSKLMGYYGPNLDEAHLPFNFQLVQLPRWQAGAVKSIVEEYEANLPPGAWPNWVLGNHDRPRIASRIGLDHSRVAQMLLLTLRGTPTCYYGDELGMQDVPISPEQTYDPRGKFDHALSRDPVRTPMQWDSRPNAGFTGPQVQPWLPLAENYRTVNVGVESEDNTSLLTLVRNLLKLRRETPALNIGSYKTISSDNNEIFAYLRQHQDQKVLVVLNFSPTSQKALLRNIEAEVNQKAEIICSTIPGNSGKTIMPGELELQSNEGVVIFL
jgi:alpha-glucosidase